MRKLLTFLLLLSCSGIYIKAYDDDISPPIEDRHIVFEAGVESFYEEARECTWSFPATEYAWIQITTLCSYDIMIELKCHNDLKGGQSTSSIVVAKAHSYRFAIDGRWYLPYVWVNEYKNIEEPFKYWGFSAKLRSGLPQDAHVIFRCFSYIDPLSAYNLIF